MGRSRVRSRRCLQEQRRSPFLFLSRQKPRLARSDPSLLDKVFPRLPLSSWLFACSRNDGTRFSSFDLRAKNRPRRLTRSPFGFLVSPLSFPPLASIPLQHPLRPLYHPPPSLPRNGSLCTSFPLLHLPTFIPPVLPLPRRR